MNAAVRKSLTAIVCLLAPPPFKRGLLNVLGHRVSSGARIGFSIVRVERLCMEAGARIGHLNWIDLRRLAKELPALAFSDVGPRPRIEIRPRPLHVAG